MSLHHSARGRLGLAIGAFGASALLLAGCAGGGGDDRHDGGDASGEPLIVGTTDKVTTLDPAGSYDNGSLAVQTQVFPYLVNTDYNSTEVVPDLAESAEFTSPTEYTVTLPEGLKWANGNDLTSSDVKFSFDRNIAIADPNGASSLLYNLDSVEAAGRHHRRLPPQGRERPDLPVHPDELPRRRSSTRRSSRPTPSPPTTDIVDGERLRRPVRDHRRTTSTRRSSSRRTTSTRACSTRPPTAASILSYFADSSNLKLAIQEGDIDVAYRSLSATDVEDLRGNDNVTGRSTAPAARSATSCSTSTRSRTARRRPRPTRPRRSPSARPSPTSSTAQAIADAGLQGHLHAAVLVRPRGLRRRHRRR